MSKFGWSYPAGAENDPFAPYNQEDPKENPTKELREAFDADFTGPYDLYRTIYNHTACGPSMGLQIEYEEVIEDGFGSGAATVTKWIYCDELGPLGTWADMESQGVIVTAISVGSIVEGVDWDCDTIVIETGQGCNVLSEAFWLAVGQVNEQAKEIWNETHGCEDCPENPETGYHMIDPDCPTCKGEGTII